MGMKSIIMLFARLCLISLLLLQSVSFAESPPVIVKPTHERAPIRSPITQEAPVTEELRFYINFPGGSAQELIAALGEASGSPVNAFIPEAAQHFTMPAFEYHNVTTKEALVAIRYNAEMPVVTRTSSGNRNIQYYSIGYSWRLVNNIWVLDVSWRPPSVPEEQDFEVLPFSISKLLEVYTIDAITTTIDSAWKLNGASEQNEIMFHPETKILLVKCPEHDMKVMQEVLKTLYDTLPTKKQQDDVEEDIEKVRVSVLGSVNKPGVYILEEGATLTDVIAIAGGESRMGNVKKISVKTAEPNVTVNEVNFSMILRGQVENIKMQDGSTVFVPERVL